MQNRCVPCGDDQIASDLKRLKGVELVPLELIVIFKRLSEAGKSCSCTGVNCYDLIKNVPTKLRDDIVGQYGSRPNPSGLALCDNEL